MAWDLGAGEAAVLTGPIAHRGTIAIVDDLAGRKCARAHGIPLKGHFGPGAQRPQEWKDRAARTALQQLRAAGMYLSDALLTKALAEIGE